MIIKCFRCGKEIDTPDTNNADYIIADDLIVKEPREVLYALKHNKATLAKGKERAAIDDSEYDTIEISSMEHSRNIERLVKVVAKIENRDIQKTGIICPDCYKPTDFVLWGVHKK